MAIQTSDVAVDEIMVAAADLLECVLKHRLVERDTISGRQDVLDYFRLTMAFQGSEQMRVLYLDAGNRLVIDELASVGTVDSLTFYPRDIVRRALEVGATALILAHNHPSGEARATRQDVVSTRHLAEICLQLGIEVHDHFVVTVNGITSMRREGHLCP